MNNIYGTSSSETLRGGAGADTIYSGGGNDTIWAGAGDDTVYGYASSQASFSNTTLYGEDGSDVLYGAAGNDSIYGGNDDDLINAGSGTNYIDGGSGNDIMSGGSGSDCYVIRDRWDEVYDSGGIDSGLIYADFYKTNNDVENWTWAPGVQRLPYWIDSLLPGAATSYAALLGGSKTFYYCFPTSVPSHFLSEDRSGFTPFNAEQKAFARQALAYISSVIDVKFVETTNAAGLNTIVFANNAQSGSAGYAYFPYDGAIGSDLFLDNTSPENLTPRDGDYSALTLIHELGHVLGLKHTFSQGDASGTAGDGPFLPTAEESTRWTVMSYTDRPADYHLRYSPFDIAALQYLYGPSAALTSNDTYALRTDSTNMIWDGGGTDMIDGSGVAQAITLYLEPGFWGYIGSQSSLISTAGQISVNFGTSIEQAKGGSANDTIIGNNVDNHLWGMEGNDILKGGEGNDVIEGGGGNDMVYGGGGSDTASFAGSRSGFAIMRTADGYSVTAAGGAEGSDTLKEVERMAFTDGSLDLDYNDAVQQLYVSYFGRAADATGLTNFATALAAANAPKDIQGLDAAYARNSTVKALVDAFGTSVESNSLYTGGTREFVTAIYQYLLNRLPDDSGLNFWCGAIESGGLSKGHAALSMMAGALANTTPQGLLDAALIGNKIRVASNFTFALDTPPEVQGYSGDAAAAAARNMLASVSSSTDVDAFQSTVTSTIASLSTATRPVTSAQEAFDDAVRIVGVVDHTVGVSLLV